MLDKEQRIQEQREVEATRKGYMGSSGKFGCIVRFLGQPIINHSEGGAFLDVYQPDFLLDGYNGSDELTPGTPEELMRQIPVWESEHATRPEGKEWMNLPEGKYMTTNHTGWFFDGLSRGMHMEIKYDEVESEITVRYKGHMVYNEVAGELLGYAPYKEWEGWIENLYKVAKKKEQELRSKEKEERAKVGNKKKQEWMRRMKQKWNL